MSKFIKTDHGQQSLALDQKTHYLLVQAMEFLQQSNQSSTVLKQQALALSDFILDAENHDLPTFFQRYKEIEVCPGCAGAGRIKFMPDNMDDEVRYEKCKMCVGEGRLYYIITKKGYAPTEQIRKQMAK